MKRMAYLRALAARAWSRFRSVPILVKILGIGWGAAFLFGSVSLVQSRGDLSPLLFKVLAERSVTGARSLAAILERPVVTGDNLAVTEALQRERAVLPEIRYALVRDRTGRIVAHTFAYATPVDLERLRRDTRSGDPYRPMVLATADGLVLDAVAPILGGYAGTVEVGVLDANLGSSRAALTRSVLWGFALSFGIGIALALLLAHFLARPIRHLARTADAIGGGDFSARARVYAGDEVGHLAQAFNRMAGSLESYREEVREKERVRVALIERIIQAQEDERRTIARELHDQLGQSLLALLMTVQADRRGRGADGPADESGDSLVTRINGLIDEVRRLAWGMRPPILDDYGLDSALARHTQEVGRQAGVPIDYQYTAAPGVGRLPSRVEVTLYRVAQEALTNVLRHAQAARASVVVLHGRDDVTLLVEDTGRGFDPQAAATADRPGLGLPGMRERVVLLGGECSIESTLGKGTLVRARIPLAPENVACPSAS